MPRSRTNKAMYLEQDKTAFMDLTEDSRWIPQSSAKPNFNSSIEDKGWGENNSHNFDDGRLNDSSEKWKDDMLERMRTRLQAKYEINSQSSPSMEDQASHIQDKKSCNKKGKPQ